MIPAPARLAEIIASRVTRLQRQSVGPNRSGALQFLLSAVGRLRARLYRPSSERVIRLNPAAILSASPRPRRRSNLLRP